MQRIILVVIIALIWGLGSPLIAQKLPPARLIEKDFRGEYRQMKKSADKEVKRLVKEDWDIVLGKYGLGEVVPTEVLDIKGPAVRALNNWGEQVLLPDYVRERLTNESQYPVLLKIGDTAGRLDHYDLQQNQLEGANYSSSTTLEDLHGHGTHVSGIAFGDGFGILSPLVEKNLAYIKPVKVLNDNGSGSFSWIANAISTERAQDVEYIEQGYGVVWNFSLSGGTTTVPEVENQLQLSEEFGILFVCAAGNSGAAVQYPALSPYTIATSSLDETMDISSFSSRGPEIDHAMPGRGILSTYLHDSYATLSGTSMASPFMAGAAGVALSKWGLETFGGIVNLREYLSVVADDLGDPGKDDLYGWGINYVISILDTPPNDMPPPPPPPPDEPRERPARDLTFYLPGGYTFFWDEFGIEGADAKGIHWLTPQDPEMVNLKSAEAYVSEMETITITDLIIRYKKVTTDAGPALDSLSNVVTTFFTNRGVQVHAPADYADAAYWASYFLERLADEQLGGLNLDVIELTATDQSGNVIRWLDKDLKHYK